MGWMFLPYRRYFDFSGRSRRMEYWLFTLLFYGVLVAMAAYTAVGSLGAELNGEEPAPADTFEFFAMILLVVFTLGSIIPAIAVQVRRFHDQDRSGWFILLNFIPYVGGLIVLVMMFLDGTPGANRFGPDPKNRTDTSVFA